MKPYKMIRGKLMKDRCTNKSTWGSPLYCKCGCQVPKDTDPDINLECITVTRQADEGYADFILSRNGQECGSINTQYNALYLDGYEFLEVDEDLIKDLLTVARNMKISDNNTIAGSTLEETAIFEKTMDIIELAEQDRHNASHPGYCKKCHSYCYGDCEA
jgi:hypothetical protein